MQVLEPRKIASVFKDRIEKHKEEVEEIEALEKVVEEIIPPNVKWSGGKDLQVIFDMIFGSETSL